MASRHKNWTKSAAVARVREFNRFYTRQIGVLQEKLLESAYSLTELRIMYDLLHENATTASELAGLLRINRGYLSRTLKRLKALGFIECTRSKADGRELLLKLTSKGRRVYAPLNQRASAEVDQLLRGLTQQEVSELLGAMATIRELLGRSQSNRRV
jgi:DNA-binding MarR family transcriptional regulator